MNIRRLILALLIVVPAIFLSFQPLPFLPGLAAVVILFGTVWLVSLSLKDAGIVDAFWGLGFTMLAGYYLLLSPGGYSFRNLILTGMVSIWGLRLAWHISRRNWGKPEDYRYQEMRAAAKGNFWWISLFQVFLLQAVILWVVASPILKAMSAPHQTGWGGFEIAGLLIWAVGMFFEVVGDAQLRRFKADPANKGKIMDRGLWRYTRHPNYFGDALVWWGIFCFAIPIHNGWYYLFSPVLMTFLLRYVSGVALLEEEMQKRPGFKEYRERTNAFFPWWPKER